MPKDMGGIKKAFQDMKDAVDRVAGIVEDTPFTRSGIPFQKEFVQEAGSHLVKLKRIEIDRTRTLTGKWWTVPLTPRQSARHTIIDVPRPANRSMLQLAYQLQFHQRFGMLPSEYFEEDTPVELPGLSYPNPHLETK